MKTTKRIMSVAPISERPVVAYALLAIVILMGIGLRIAFVTKNLPFIYDPDEPFFVGAAVRMVSTGDLNPHWFGHPGTVLMYTLAIAYWIYGLIEISSGGISTLAEVYAQYHWDPAVFHLIGRIVVVSWSLLSFVGTWLVASQLMGRWMSLISVLGLALIPQHMLLSANVRTDIPQTALALLAIYFSIRAFNSGRLVHYILCGIFIGIGVSTKYPTVIIATSLVMAAVFRIDRERSLISIWEELRRLLIAGIACILFSFLSSPFLFLDFSTALRNILLEARPYHLSATSSGFFPALFFYLNGALKQLTPFAYFLSAIAIMWSIYKRDKAVLILTITFICYLTFISLQSLQWARWATPLLPMLAILATLGLNCIYIVLLKWLSKPISILIILLTTALWLWNPMQDTLRVVKNSTSMNSATRAYYWMTENIPAGSRILSERYTPQLPNGKYEIFNVKDGRLTLISQTSKYIKPNEIVGNMRYTSDIGEQHIQYLVLGNDWERRKKEPVRYKDQLKKYEKITAGMELIAEFGPIKIYKSMAPDSQR